MNRIHAISEYLNRKGWVSLQDPEEEIVLLGRSQTNESYLITVQEIYGEARYVFRVNLDSHMGLTDQAEYEFSVLQALRRSGVTPRPFYCDTEQCGDLGNGVLFMEYLPGRHFTYATDFAVAAKALAAIHSQSVDPRLIVRENTIGDAARECQIAIDNLSSPRSGIIVSGMKKLVEELEWYEGKAADLLAGEPFVMVHGSPGAPEFIVEEDGDKAWLIDWEDGMVSHRYFDLGQFMFRASRAGETGYCRNDEEKRKFLKVYAEAAGLEMDTDDILKRAAIFIKAAELWSNSWSCVALSGMSGKTE